MAFLARFSQMGMTIDKYNESVRLLEAAGCGAPAGRLYHVCFGDKSNVSVSDIWDTTENFEAFGKTLMPILHQLGVDPGQPQIIEVQNIIAGAKTLAAER